MPDHGCGERLRASLPASRHRYGGRPARLFARRKHGQNRSKAFSCFTSHVALVRPGGSGLCGERGDAALAALGERALHAVLDERWPCEIAMDACKAHEAVCVPEHYVMARSVIGQDQNVLDLIEG